MRSLSFKKIVAKVLIVAMMLNMQNIVFMQRVFADAIENQEEIVDEERTLSYREEAYGEGFAELAHTNDEAAGDENADGSLVSDSHGGSLVGEDADGSLVGTSLASADDEEEIDYPEEPEEEEPEEDVEEVVEDTTLVDVENEDNVGDEVADDGLAELAHIDDDEEVVDDEDVDESLVGASLASAIATDSEADDIDNNIEENEADEV
ncbi:MAG: hypothetical protein MJ151_01975, partial [Lachnospiraceae bacterium]|nr:hypothetical protein [Lachnospiraceae bacterium]